MATEEEANKFLNSIMDQIDKAFNGPVVPGVQRNVGLILMVFPAQSDPDTAHCTVTTNGIQRDHAVEILKAQLSRLEAYPTPAPN